MSEFLLFLFVELLKIGAGLLIFGLALYKNFEKCDIAPWKALIPFYNIWTWIKLTKNPNWLFFVLLQFFVLPLWWIIAISFFVLAILCMDTYSLYTKNIYYPFVVIITILVIGIANFLNPDIGILVNYAGLVLAFGFLYFIGSSSDLVFDSERYYTQEFSFSDYAIKQFKKNKPALVSVYILGFLVMIAVYADYIANDQPLYVKYQGKQYFPAYLSIFNPNFVDSVTNPFTGNPERLQFDIASWKQMQLDKVVWPLIPYSQDKYDRYNREYVSPTQVQRFKNVEGDIVDMPFKMGHPLFKFRHHMGTDGIGQDVLAGLLHGTRISLTIGIISMGIASIIGIVLGSLAGYYGDRDFKTTRFRFYYVLIGIALSLFYLAEGGEFIFGVSKVVLAILVFLGFVFTGSILGKIFEKSFLKKEVAVPIDSIVMRFIEVLNSLPSLLIIITIAGIYGRSMTMLMVIIGAISWTGIARFTRAEFLRTRSLEFIDAAKSLGFNDFRIIFKHALPNSVAPVFVSIAFGIASAILIESGLSFIGIGVPDDITTWGGMLNKGRIEFEAKWLVIYPGLAIFLTVTVFNLIGEALRDALDPKLKQ